MRPQNFGRACSAPPCRGIKTESAQVNQYGSLQQLLRRHRQHAARRLAAGERAAVTLAAAPGANSDAMPCVIDQMCSATISAGGLPWDGIIATSCSEAARKTAKAFSLTSRSSRLVSSAPPASNIAES